MENLHTYIGKLAVEKGYITEEQLKECIDILDEGENITIEELLLKKKYITPEKLKYLINKREFNIKQIEDNILKDYIIKMKILSKDTIEKCMEIQKKTLKKEKKYITLSNILISSKLLKPEEVKEIRQAPEVKRAVKEKISEDDPRSTALIGRVLGGYEIISKIAAGGMGVVFRANQVELERIVALKILFNKFASNKKYLKQFYREARLSAILNHPNLVHIFEMGNTQGFFYYSMELVEGENLGDILKEEGKVSQERALDIITQAARGLEHIHNYDIVHRDIKPSNFMIRKDNILKIMDLGLAREVSKLTRKVATIGTPYYMAPELITNPEEVDQRVDIYALGVSFYKLVTGEYPITGRTPKEILDNIIKQVPKPVTEIDPTINVKIERVISKMIEKDPKKRYQNMTEVLNDLDGILLYD